MAGEQLKQMTLLRAESKRIDIWSDPDFNVAHGKEGHLTLHIINYKMPLKVTKSRIPMILFKWVIF